MFLVKDKSRITKFVLSRIIRYDEKSKFIFDNRIFYIFFIFTCGPLALTDNTGSPVYVWDAVF